MKPTQIPSRDVADASAAQVASVAAGCGGLVAAQQVAMATALINLRRVVSEMGSHLQLIQHRSSLASDGVAGMMLNGLRMRSLVTPAAHRLHYARDWAVVRRRWTWHDDRSLLGGYGRCRLQG